MHDDVVKQERVRAWRHFSYMHPLRWKFEYMLLEMQTTLEMRSLRARNRCSSDFSVIGNAGIKAMIYCKAYDWLKTKIAHYDWLVDSQIDLPSLLILLATPNMNRFDNTQATTLKRVEFCTEGQNGGLSLRVY